MTTPESTPNRDDMKVSPHFRLALSRNQKKRSKLQQAPEEAEAAPKPEPVPPPASTPPAPPPLLRRNRLKRSGHMHDDLTKPLPEDGTPERESEY